MIAPHSVAELGPRLVVAGTNSGVGKTTVATGLMAALGAAGHRVGAAKVGPDFIDPGYHALATGRASRNLDIWMSGPESVLRSAAKAGRDTDVLVIEGVMGMFDGASDGTPSSTAEVAKLVGAPTVLVVDVSSMNQSAAALVHGFATFDPSLNLAGLILNRVASPTHEAELRRALAGARVPILGVLYRDERLTWRDRHLGLVPVAEDPAAIARSIEHLGQLVAQRCDIEAIMTLARTAAPKSVSVPVAEAPSGPRVRIAVASGPAFSFTYPDNLEAVEAAGAELLVFDPTVDEALPTGSCGLLAGGGFPEVFAPQLAANRPLLGQVRSSIEAGLVTWAECGGLLWLCEELDGEPMAGALATRAEMTDRLNLGYRSATTTRLSPLGRAGLSLRGHEFHYSSTDPHGDLLQMEGRKGASSGGFGSPSVFASYLHLHLGARPDLAHAFVASCRRGPRVR